MIDLIFLYPLVIYLLICTFAFSIFKFDNIITHNFPIFIFLLFISPSVLNVLMHDYYNFDQNHFSALNYISSNHFFFSISLYFFLVFITVLLYKFFTEFRTMNNFSYQKKLEKWIIFSKKSEKDIFRWLLFIVFICGAAGLYIRFGFYAAEQFYAPLKGDSVKNIANASYGRSQVLEVIFFQIINLAYYICLEYRKKFLSIFLFSYFLLTSLYVGSKAGFIIIIFWTLLYLFFRKIIKFKWRYIFLLLLIAVPSFILGDYSRTFFQGTDLDGEATLSMFGWVENLSKRDVSIAQTSVMIIDQNFYKHLIPEYLKSIFGLAIPSFIWPDKPITPGYAIAELFGFGVQSAAPGWLGGFMFIFGHSGLIFGPIILAFTLAYFSNKLSFYSENPSLHYPLIFMIFIELSGFFMDGGYHSILPTFIALFLTFTLFFSLVIILNGKLQKPPL